MNDTDVRRYLQMTADVLAADPVAPRPDAIRGARTRVLRRRGLAGAAALLSIALVAAAVPALLRSDPSVEVVDRPYPDEGPGTVADLAAARWSELPAAPLAARTEPVAVWTGDRLLVWGGGTADQATMYADGAEFDPSTDTWQLLPASPLSPRMWMSSVWTGELLVVWGGVDKTAEPFLAADGATYDPSTRTWQMLPPSPIRPRWGAEAIWTGIEVVLLGGTHTQPGVSQVDGAAWNPETGMWRTIPPIDLGPDLANGTTTVAVAGELYLWVNRMHAPAIGGIGDQSGSIAGRDGRRSSLFKLVVGAGSWEPVSWPGETGRVEAAYWTGREVIVPASSRMVIGASGITRPAPVGRRLDPASGTWTDIAAGPADGGTGVWTGSALVHFGSFPATSPFAPAGGREIRAAAWDPVEGTWTDIAAPPRSGDVPTVWTGTELLQWGFMGSLNPPYGYRASGLRLRSQPDGVAAYRASVAPAPATCTPPAGAEAAAAPSRTDYDLARGVRIPITRTGQYAFRTQPVATSRPVTSFGVGRSMEGDGTAQVKDVKLELCREEAGIFGIVTITVTEFTGSPVLVVVRASFSTT